MSAYIYFRVNLEDQVATQLSLCNEKSKSLEIHNPICFIDRNVSTRKDRPQFNKMISNIKNGDVVITPSPDRLFRDMKKLVDFTSKYKVYYASGNYDIPETLNFFKPKLFIGKEPAK
jgi:DNA invertase Pin-like site-specific DNA recombinase